MEDKERELTTGSRRSGHGQQQKVRDVAGGGSREVVQEVADSSPLKRSPLAHPPLPLAIMRTSCARPLPSAVAVARAACPHQPPGRQVQLRPSAALGSLAEEMQRRAPSMLNLAK
jgi:hypothetical protein